MDQPPRTNPKTIEIFLANQPRFLAFLRRHVSDSAEAEDLLQHALLKAMRHESDWNAKENILAWFYRILRNVLTDHYRSRASEQRKLEAMQVEPTPDISEEERAQLCTCFEGLLPALKPEYAEVLRRVDLGLEEPSQVAASLGVTPNNLSVRLHRARQSLRTNLEKTCGVCIRHGCLDCTCGEGQKPA